ncbi:MAG TPA: ATP-binding protein [Pontiella sp.]
MSLKSKILLIIFIASTTAAALAGPLLVVLMKVFGYTITSPAANGAALPFPVIIAGVIYLLSGLFVLVLLNILLSKNVVMPAVDREMMESEREMLTKQLHHSQKMEAVGRLAGSIAHDFNNLLTIIDGYSSLIVANPEGEDVSRNAKEVIEAARKASFITRKLLTFSRQEESESVLLDLNSTLQDTNKMLTRLIGEKITLVTQACNEPVYVRSNPIQVGQILMNLAVNARDAMPKGGRITIAINRLWLNDGECSKPDILDAGEYAEISVQDTGFGIDPETLESMFEAFFTTKQADQGTGLGLSIVKSILKENQGFITVKSKVGNGTTFRIYLPITEPENTSAEEKIRATIGDVKPKVDAEHSKKTSVAGKSVADNGKPTILLVEDDLMIRNLVSQTLEAENNHVLLAEEGWEGIKIARNYQGNIDLLFTDVVMPGLGGVELAMAAKELYPNIKVLFMSGYSKEQLTEEGVPPGASVLEKPFTPATVKTVVAQLLS